MMDVLNTIENKLTQLGEYISGVECAKRHYVNSGAQVLYADFHKASIICNYHINIERHLVILMSFLSTFYDVGFFITLLAAFCCCMQVANLLYADKVWEQVTADYSTNNLDKVYQKKHRRFERMTLAFEIISANMVVIPAILVMYHQAFSIFFIFGFIVNCTLSVIQERSSKKTLQFLLFEPFTYSERILVKQGMSKSEHTSSYLILKADEFIVCSFDGSKSTRYKRTEDTEITISGDLNMTIESKNYEKYAK